jgi:glutamate 5-kinase
MRLVIKTGSAVLSRPQGGLDRSAVDRVASQLSAVPRQGHQVVLVTSGAIAAGVARLGWKRRPKDLRSKQTAAAVGQLALMEAYEAALSKAKIIPAQLLLTREDLLDKERRSNIQQTLLHLLSLRTIPIINENDSVLIEEIKFGDNDILAATVAVKINADKLILFSDVPGMFE